MTLNRPRSLLVAVAFAAFISLGLPDGVLGVAWPSIRRDLGVSLDRLGLLFATSMAGYLTSTTLSGEMVRRIGFGRLLLFSTIIVVGSLAGFAAAPTWSLFIALGFFAGLGAGAIDAAINAFAATRFPPGHVAWLHASYGIGATAGPLTMTAVLAAGHPWRVGYGMLASALAVMAVLFLVTLRLWDDTGPRTTGPAAPAATATQALRRPMVWLHALLFFIYTGIEVTAAQWLYSVFTESRSIKPTFAGVCVGLFWGGLTAGRIAFGLLTRRLAPAAIVRMGMCAAPLSGATLSVDGSPLITAFGCASLGFALAPIYPMLVSLTPARVGDAYAAQSIGFQVSAAYVGIAALPTLAGVLARRATLEAVPPFIVGCALVLLLLHEFVISLTAKSSSPRP